MFTGCRNYSVADAAEGKAAAKAELCARMGLGDADAPLVAVVTRLTHQKGIHLIKHAAWRTLERGGQFVLLGSAPDPRVQARPSDPAPSAPVLGSCFGVRSSTPPGAPWSAAGIRCCWAWRPTQVFPPLTFLSRYLFW